MAEMIKKYTRAEWARLQAKLPDEDKVPYEDSPEIPAPEKKPEPGEDLKKKNLSPQEQIYFLKEEQKRVEQLLADAEKQYQTLTKTPEQIAADEKKAQEKSGNAPVKGATDVGSAQARAEAADTASEQFGAVPQTQAPGAVGTKGTAQQQQQVINEQQEKENKRENKYVAGIIDTLEQGGAISGEDVKTLTRGVGTGTNQNISGENLFPPYPGTGGGQGGATGATGPVFTFGGFGGATGATGATKTTGATGPIPSAGSSTNIDVLKAMLLSMGFSSSIIDSSSTYLLNLLKDGLDYDNAVTVFLNLKEYTTKDGNKLISPFYEAYGYLNEGLARPKPPAELYNAVEGYKEVAAKYNLNSKFLSKDYLKNYVKNNVTVADLDERANTARLKAVNADPAYLDSLKKLGYISGAADLTDFFMDPTIGQETLEQRRGTAAFATEAIRRAGQGITFAGGRFGQTAANLVGLGLSEAQISNYAAQGFENIAEQLAPTQRLASIYEQLPAKQLQDIQSELEAEQFGGTASQRRKKLKELETLAFAGEAGTNAYSLKKGSAAGQI